MSWLFPSCHPQPPECLLLSRPHQMLLRWSLESQASALGDTEQMMRG